MNVLTWVRPIANLVAILGFLAILVGVLACQNYPIFNSLAEINCELGYYGLFMVLFGFVCAEWSTKKLDGVS